MKTDNVLLSEGVSLLIRALGELETERFIHLLKSENFDYTTWQQGLWADLSIDEVYNLAQKREGLK